MDAVVRTYSEQGASELFDLLGKHEEDVKALVSGDTRRGALPPATRRSSATNSSHTRRRQ
jgi:hypothetical protein